MKKVLISLIFLVFGVLLFVRLMGQIGPEELKRAIFAFSLPGGLIILLLAFQTQLLATFRWQSVLKSFGYDFSLKELFGPTLSCFAIYYLAPTAFLGADLFRSHALSERKKMSLEKRIASTIIDRVSNTIPIIVFMAIGLPIFFLKTNFLFKYWQLVIIGCLFLLVFILFFGSRLRKKILKEKSVLNLFIKVDKNQVTGRVEKEIFNFFRFKKPGVKKVIIISFLMYFVEMIRFWFLVLFLGKMLSGVALISIFSVAVSAVEIPVSADLGSYDLIMSFVFNALGLGLGRGAAFALIIRAINIFLTLIGLWFVFRIGVQNLFDSVARRVEKLINSNS